MRAIAHIHTDFPTKFGIPRQSGLVGALEGIVVFEPQFRSEGALRGLETYSHVWLLWVFSRALREGWSPTVRPPRLGGNKRMGVFATRSPFRPNAIGLSAVRLVGVEQTERFGAVLRVAGVDLMDNTPILDVKPYLPFADAVADASGGFSAGAQEGLLAVECPPQLLELVPPDRRQALLGVLANDPRPSYQDDPERLYGFCFAGLEIKFTVADGKAVVRRIEKA
ncbi:MAG TPA: tRNA (N6-threonylcarbamoyladenosine(37)-N6)-methyltransferase TrmO [Candidatus Aphodomonas merdavium]|nr:tRNA (N6-threonylcarbamoyladenosine(37)-N6)-methyltransferase TrmO [Candidatus Aphodomonas merdavium]